ncbi:MAG: response regulator [Xanthomonadaceae bacterium]|nr:response regulator [Xanthomonadaceae bacterium]
MSLPAGLRVLLVEDEVLVGMLLEDILTDLGCEVVGPMTSVDAAIEFASNASVDVALLDINLTGADAYPVAEVLAGRGIAFGFLTGYQSVHPDFEQYPSLGKPVDRKALEAVLVSLDPRRTQG